MGTWVVVVSDGMGGGGDWPCIPDFQRVGNQGVERWILFSSLLGKVSDPVVLLVSSGPRRCRLGPTLSTKLIPSGRKLGAFAEDSDLLFSLHPKVARMHRVLLRVIYFWDGKVASMVNGLFQAENWASEKDFSRFLVFNEQGLKGSVWS